MAKAIIPNGAQQGIDDEGNRQCIRAAFKTMKSFIAVAHNHMLPGGRADLVNHALRTIESIANSAQQFTWPDLEARAAADARKDKALQKLLKQAARKTPI